MAISLDSDYSAAHTGRALLYEQDGLYDKAREGFRDAMRAKSAFADDDWAHKTAQEHLEKLKDK
jgi:Tfp pilus assembly protein PilF